jgi:putative heme transporter
VFFIVTLLGSFIPTPGGVGVIEAGLSGALVASGVAPTSALAAVLVYRLITYVMPILFGAVLYLFWRGGAAARARVDVGDTARVAGTPKLVPAIVDA